MSGNPVDAAFASVAPPSAPPAPSAIDPSDNPLNQIFAQPKQAAAKPVESNPLNSIFANPVAQQPPQPQPNPLDQIFQNGITPAATAQTTQPDTTWDKIKSFANHPLTSLFGADLSMPELALPVEAGEALTNYLQQHGHDTLAKVSGAYAGTEDAALQQARGMTSPMNLLITAATSGFGSVAQAKPALQAIARVANLGFSGDMLWNAYQHIPDVKKAIQAGDAEGAAKAITEGLGSVALAGMTGLHSLGSAEPTETAKAKNAPLSKAPLVQIVDSDAAKLEAEKAHAAETETAKTPVNKGENATRDASGRFVKANSNGNESTESNEEKPIKVFHGTSGDITDVTQLAPEKFGQPGELGIGSYVSLSPKIASDFGYSSSFAPGDVSGSRVLGGEIQPGTKLLDADASLPEELQKTLEEKFGETGLPKGTDTVRDFLASTVGDKNGTLELEKAVADAGYRGFKSDDLHGAPGMLLFGEDITGKPLSDVLKPTVPTAKIVPDSYTPTVSKDEILSEATQRILRNAPKLQSIIDPTKLNSADDIRTALQVAAQHIENNIDPRVGTRISFDAQKQLASDLGMPIEELLNKKSGEAFNAETALASRAMLQTSADNVLDLAKKAAGGDADARTQLAFSIARHQEIENQISGVRAEAGRALGSWRIPDSDLPSVKISAAMSQLTPEALDQASQLLSRIDPTDTKAVNGFIRQIEPSSTPDKLYEWYRNALLSGPQTVIKKAASEFSLAALEALRKVGTGVAERAKQAAGISDAEAYPSEGYYYSKGFAQALANGRKILNGEFTLEGMPDFEELGKKEAIKGTLGKVVRAPGTLLEKQTNLIYAANYFGELNALSARQAISEGLTGQEASARQDYLAHNPTKEMQASANKQALYGTFQSRLSASGENLGRSIQQSPWAKWLFPFYRTPINIFKTATDFSPVGVLKGTIQGDLNTQMRGILGSTIAAAIGYLAVNHHISGGGSLNYKQRQTQEATGWQPYSVRVGNKWYSYSRLEPIGLLMGLTADAVHGSLSDEDPAVSNAKSVNVIGHISRNVESIPFLMQLSEIVDSLTNLGKGNTTERMIDNLLASSVVPAGLKDIAQGTDRTVRSPQHAGLWPPQNMIPGISQTIEERTPGLTKNVPADIDVTGAPVQRPASALGGANPFAVTTQKNDPVVAEMARLGLSVENAPKVIKRFPKDPNPITLTPNESAALQQAETKRFYDLMSRAVTNPNWKNVPDDEKKVIATELKRAITAGRLERLQQIRMALAGRGIR